MRWLSLYARSRQVPLSLLSMVLSTAVVWALTRSGPQNAAADPRLPVLALAAGIAVASTGLGGQDVALDRTAAVRWAPRRAGHALGIGIIACAVMLTAQAADGIAESFVIARASGGLIGLAAIGATLWGAPYAWAMPFAWCAVACFVPPTQQGGGEVVTWMLQPSDSAASAWTSAVLVVTGLLLYALAGPGRHLASR